VAGAAGADCASPGSIFGVLYSEPLPSGWRAEVYEATGTPGACTLKGVDSTAVLGATGLRIETRWKQVEPPAGAPCDVDEARARRATMTCAEYEVLTATRR